MRDSITVALAQMNLLVGAIGYNVDRIIEFARRAKNELHADLMICSELALTGYPPQDLLLRSDFRRQTEEQLQRLCRELPDIDLLIGYPGEIGHYYHNIAALICGGEIVARYAKRKLPNYSVFDERRYFAEGSEPLVIDYGGIKLGVTICEDIWHEGPIQDTVDAGAECIINMNASPYEMHKLDQRHTVIRSKCRQLQVAVIYVNQIGGQDELVFDGASFVVDKHGKVAHQVDSFRESLTTIQVHKQGEITGRIHSSPLPYLESIYQAVVLGVRDYVCKNNFTSVVIGLSGGIDSALTTAIAVDALGAHRVTTLMMPFRYTSDASVEDAGMIAQRLNVTHHEVSIESMYEAIVQQLSALFAGCTKDITEENIQARCRGLTLMAYSNNVGGLVLTTGNKSEMAVGYATLYGDMVGGFNALKDIPKTLVYRLTEYRNTVSPVIPDRVLHRAPSAELRNQQQDSDSLPEYEVLDTILELYIEEELSPEEIISRGFADADVKDVVRLVNLNEHKRYQAPPGVRISRRSFGRDRRYPITQGFWKGCV